MLHDNYHPNLQPRQGQNGIGNLEHDNIISYLNHNKRLNGGASSEKNKAEKDKRLKKKNAKTRKKYQMSANINGTRFEIVKIVLESFGFTLRDDDVYKNSFLIWTDSFISQERLVELKSYQHINHFMGMVEICRKDYLAKNIARMQKLRPDDFNYFPKSWIYPQDKTIIQKYIKDHKNPKHKKYFILKPSNGAMGIGIHLFSEDDTIRTTESSILQEYIERPFLLDGFKNDLRIYVLLTSCDPLRVFIYREGLVRLSTEKYALPLNPKSESLFMHLTNYSVNKKNSNYSKGIDESSGSKRSLSSVMNLFKTKFKVDVDILWKSIIDIIVKTLLLVQPYLIHNYKMCRPGENPTTNSICFEILGFDIILDQSLRPWLLEVNRSPSFGMDEMLDKKVKGGLLDDTLRLLNIKPSDKEKCISLQKQRVVRRLTLAAVRSKVDTQLSNDALKRRKDVEKRKQELIDLYIRIKSAASIEYFENRNLGNFSRIFPPDEKVAADHYSKILIDSFTLFNQMHAPNIPSDIIQATNQTMQSFMQNQFREEDLLEQIKECEKEENAILEKFSLVPNAETTTIIPKDDFFDISSEEDSSSSTDESEICEKTSDDELTLGNQSRTNKTISSRNSISDHKTSNKIQKKFISTPQGSQRSISALSKTSSLNSESIHFTKADVDMKYDKRLMTMRNDAAKKKVFQSHANQAFFELKKKYKNIGNQSEEDKMSDDSCFLEDFDNLNLKPKGFEVQIYEEVLKVILTALNNLSIRYPGQSDSETKTMLLKINSNWDTYHQDIATYWLVTLNSSKREKILKIVKNNVSMIIKENFKYSKDMRANTLNRHLSKVYNRLSWNRGHGLVQCFRNPKSWKLIFSQTNDQIKPNEIEICSRVVQLCIDCVLIVHQFSNQLFYSERENASKTLIARSIVSEQNFTNPCSINLLGSISISPSS